MGLPEGSTGFAGLAEEEAEFFERGGKGVAGCHLLRFCDCDCDCDCGVEEWKCCAIARVEAL